MKDHKNKKEEPSLREFAGIWTDIKEDSVTYVRKLRKEYEEREKRFGLVINNKHKTKST